MCPFSAGAPERGIACEFHGREPHSCSHGHGLTSTMPNHSPDFTTDPLNPFSASSSNRTITPNRQISPTIRQLRGVWLQFETAEYLSTTGWNIIGLLCSLSCRIAWLHDCALCGNRSGHLGAGGQAPRP